MRILYGVQGTGNGHITRARAMARALKEAGAEVDWVFSGRDPKDYFDMEIFGDFQHYRGLTLYVRAGRLLYAQTLLKNSLAQLYRDSRSIAIEGYDLIINDFEPVTAWAARRVGKPVLGLSHQNAFLFDIPKSGYNFFVARFMRYFAPVSQPIGVHWHHFGQPILPPLVEPSRYNNESEPGRYLVYLPFNELSSTIAVLKQLPESQFYIYHNIDKPSDDGHLHLRPLAREGFQKDLHICTGVICNAGFELSSEAIQLGKKLLVQPVKGQMEQQSNALALRQLNYGSACKLLDAQTVRDWLTTPKPAPVHYPNVSQALAKWITAGAKPETFANLHTTLWQPDPEVLTESVTSVQV